MALAFSAEPLPGDQAGRGHRLDTKRGQIKFLMEELGVTGAQANSLIRAYHLDQRDRQARQASAVEFGGWLRSNYWRAVARTDRGAR